MAILVSQPSPVESPKWMPRVVHLSCAGRPEHENMQHRCTNDVVFFNGNFNIYEVELKGSFIGTFEAVVWSQIFYLLLVSHS